MSLRYESKDESPFKDSRLPLAIQWAFNSVVTGEFLEQHGRIPGQRALAGMRQYFQHGCYFRRWNFLKRSRPTISEQDRRSAGKANNLIDLPGCANFVAIHKLFPLHAAEDGLIEDRTRSRFSGVNAVCISVDSVCPTPARCERDTIRLTIGADGSWYSAEPGAIEAD